MTALPIETRDRTDRSLVERVVAALLPSLADVIFIAILLGVIFGLQGKALGYDGDAAWNLRIGLHILQNGIPRTEFLLSTSYGQPTIYWEWLSQVAYAGAYLLGGLNGAVALDGVLVAITAASLYIILRRHGANVLLSLTLALIGSGLTSITWTARAQLFSLLLTVWWTEWIWTYWRTGNRKQLWVFPLAMALWANLHGGFIGGLILLGLATLVSWLFPRSRGASRPRDLAAALIASAIATLVTPWGFALPVHIVEFFRNPLITRYTQEYQSPDFHSLSALIFLALVLVLVAVWLRSVVADTLRLPPPEPLAVVIAAVWTVMAFGSVRFVPLWALIVLPILGHELAQLGKRFDVYLGLSNALEPDSRMHALAGKAFRKLTAFSVNLERTDAQVGKGIWSAVTVLLLAIFLLNGSTMPGSHSPAFSSQFDSRVFPVAAAQRLHKDGVPAGVGFTTFQWGGYLDFALPEYHPFIDSRSDVYSQQFLQDYATIIALQPGWHTLLAKYHVQWALLPTHEPLAQVLSLTPGWSCAAEDSDNVAVLCTKSSTMPHVSG